MDFNHQSSSEKIRVNGKAQIIEMLKYMNDDERSTLLKNIILRNPSMGRELMEESFTFQNFMSLEDHAILRTLSYVNPAIIGVALKGCPMSFQKRVLSLIDRSIAEQAFDFMQRNISNPLRDSQKAQDKICQTAIALYKRRVIKF